jgi:putative toxin-antitoxin system antitoxin component (TIGR02293 family)
MSALQNHFFESLGLQSSEITNRASFIRSVREGISGDVVKQAVKIFGNRDLFVRILGTTSSNLSRYYRLKKMTRADSEEMLDTIRLYSYALNVFGDHDKTNEWLNTSVAALSGENPVTLFDTFEGREWVSQVLRKIEYGEFV